MSQLTHTPGPWSAVLDDCPTTQDRWIVEKREQGWKTFIAEVYANPEHPAGALWQGTKEANAFLIAAAPDLLAACIEFVRKCNAGQAKSRRSYAQMKAAIAKAEGRSHIKSAR